MPAAGAHGAVDTLLTPRAAQLDAANAASAAASASAAATAVVDLVAATSDGGCAAAGRRLGDLVRHAPGAVVRALAPHAALLLTTHPADDVGRLVLDVLTYAVNADPAAASEACVEACVAGARAAEPDVAGGACRLGSALVKAPGLVGSHHLMTLVALYGDLARRHRRRTVRAAAVNTLAELACTAARDDAVNAVQTAAAYLVAASHDPHGALRETAVRAAGRVATAGRGEEHSPSPSSGPAIQAGLVPAFMLGLTDSDGCVQAEAARGLVAGGLVVLHPASPRFVPARDLAYAQPLNALPDCYSCQLDPALVGPVLEYVAGAPMPELAARGLWALALLAGHALGNRVADVLGCLRDLLHDGSEPTARKAAALASQALGASLSPGTWPRALRELDGGGTLMLSSLLFGCGACVQVEWGGLPSFGHTPN